MAEPIGTLREHLEKALECLTDEFNAGRAGPSGLRAQAIAHVRYAVVLLGGPVPTWSYPDNVEDLRERHRADPADHRREPACLACGAPFPCATFDLLMDYDQLRRIHG